MTRTLQLPGRRVTLRSGRFGDMDGFVRATELLEAEGVTLERLFSVSTDNPIGFELGSRKAFLTFFTPKRLALLAFACCEGDLETHRDWVNTLESNAWVRQVIDALIPHLIDFFLNLSFGSETILTNSPKNENHAQAGPQPSPTCTSSGDESRNPCSSTPETGATSNT